MFFITLISDLGAGNASVSVPRALLMQQLPQAAIVDITHQVLPYDLHQAAYVFKAAYPNFPKNTLHVCLIDIFSDPAPRMVLATMDGHYFLAPDNGFFALVFEGAIQDSKLAFTANATTNFADWCKQVATVAAMVNDNQWSRIALPEYSAHKVSQIVQPKQTGNTVECNVLYIDRFENVVLNIKKDQFEAFVDTKPFRIQIIGSKDINTLSAQYSDVKLLEPLCRFNEAGYLEIAVNHGSAKHKLGLHKLSPRELYYQTVKVFIG